MELHENAVRKIEHVAGGRIESIEKIGNGVSNVVYLVKANQRSFSLKIKERGLYDFFKNESSALSILQGYIAPKLHLYDDSDPNNKFLLLEYIAGHPIRSISEIGVSELVSLASKIHLRTRRENAVPSDLHSELKGYLVEKCFSSLPQLEKIPFSRIPELTQACDRVVACSARFNYADPSHEVLIHGDLNVTNILREDSGVWRLIDWELSRFAQSETEIAALIWAHCRTEQDFSNLFESDLCAGKKEVLTILTLARGLDVSTWRTKWIHSLDQNDEKWEFYHSELEEDWAKIKMLEAYL